MSHGLAPTLAPDDGHDGRSDSHCDSHGDSDLLAAIAALRAGPAAGVNPVRLRHMELMSQRLGQQTDAVRRILASRLRRMLAEQVEHATPLPHVVPATQLDPRLLPKPKPTPVVAPPASPLALLTQRLSQPQPQLQSQQTSAPVSTPVSPPRRTELKSTQRFRETWARVAADRQVEQALARAPDNAGPLNSHLLVLRSLGVMRELSPDYLRRFLAHVEALQWLDQATQKPTAADAKPARRARAKK
nr:DUF2894 domain-containing protein [uncultured Aquabacterium sp.]